MGDVASLFSDIAPPASPTPVDQLFSDIKTPEAAPAPAPNAPAGLRAKGNIDLANRPVTKNADGSYSTVKSMSIGTDDGEVLIPMVSPSGTVLSKEGAIARYKATGEHLGVFDSPESATAFAQNLHQSQADLYNPTPGKITPRGNPMRSQATQPPDKSSLGYRAGEAIGKVGNKAADIVKGAAAGAVEGAKEGFGEGLSEEELAPLRGSILNKPGEYWPHRTLSELLIKGVNTAGRAGTAAVEGAARGVQGALNPIDPEAGRTAGAMIEYGAMRGDMTLGAPHVMSLSDRLLAARAPLAREAPAGIPPEAAPAVAAPPVVPPSAPAEVPAYLPDRNAKSAIPAYLPDRNAQAVARVAPALEAGIADAVRPQPATAVPPVAATPPVTPTEIARAAVQQRIDALGQRTRAFRAKGPAPIVHPVVAEAIKAEAAKAAAPVPVEDLFANVKPAEVAPVIKPAPAAAVILAREEAKAAPSPEAGKRHEPVTVEAAKDLETAGKVVNVEPTPAQAEAGNYQKAHVEIQGIPIAIENPKGSVRKGIGEDGKPWEATLPAHYGYIKKAEGADGDKLDVYVGDDVRSPKAFIIDQKDLKTGKFDEHKIVLGARTLDEAETLYANAFSDGQGAKRIASTEEMSVDQLKGWIADGGGEKGPASETIKPVESKEAAAVASKELPKDERENTVAETPAQKAEAAKIVASPEVQAEITTPRTIDRTHDIPGTAGSSKEGGITYIDRNVPEALPVKTLDGKETTVDPAKYLNIHEQVEHALMVDGKMPYHEAHFDHATVAEHAALREDNIDPVSYEAAMKPFIEKVWNEKPANPPEDLYVKPYPHNEQGLLESRGVAKDTAENVSAAPEPAEAAPEKAAPAMEAAKPATKPLKGVRAEAARRVEKAAPVKKTARPVEKAAAPIKQVREPEPKAKIVRQRKATVPNPDGILQFIASKGGIKPNSDLRALDAHRKFVPGVGRFVREDGKDADYMREAAAEAGYLNHTGKDPVADSTPSDLYNLIDRALAGEKVRPADATPDVKGEQATARRAAESAVEKAAAEMDLDTDAPLIARAAELVMHGADPMDALERATMALAVEDTRLPEDILAGIEQSMGGNWDANEAAMGGWRELPGWEREEVQEPAGRKGAEGPRGALQEAGNRESAARAEDRSSQAGSPAGKRLAASSSNAPPKDAEGLGPAGGRRGAEERLPDAGEGKVAGTETTEAGQQRVLPGAERISDRALAERKAAAPLRAKVAQKLGMDEGLFGDDHKQTTLLSTASRRDRGPVFVSAAVKAAENAKITKGTPDQWLASIRNTPGVKAEELKWIGLEDWLKGQKGTLTKEEVAGFIRANQIEVKDKVLGGKTDPELEEEHTRLLEERSRLGAAYERAERGEGDVKAIMKEYEAIDAQLNEIEAKDTSGPPTKFSGYQTPGGANYREVLLTLPIEETRRADGGIDEGPIFRSGHFDEANVIAHLRVNERLDAAGRRTLFVEEVQSDFGQQTRRAQAMIAEAVDRDFDSIAAAMVKAGVIEKVCD